MARKPRNKPAAFTLTAAALLSLCAAQPAAAAPAAECLPGVLITKVKPDLSLDLIGLPSTCQEQVVLGHGGAYSGDVSWLERADTGPHPATWVTPIAKSTNTIGMTRGVPYESYWWRVCGVYTRPSGTGTYCGDWYHITDYFT